MIGLETGLVDTLSSSDPAKMAAFDCTEPPRLLP